MSRVAGRLRGGLPGLFVTLSIAVPAAAQTGAVCDRACLMAIADAYFAAIAAHDPSKAPMAPNAKFVEQVQAIAVGDGLWKTASEGPSAFTVYVPDPVAGQIGGIVMMKDVGPKQEARTIQLAFRLKVQNRQITEAEHLIAPITGAPQLANLVTPRPGLRETVPSAGRLPREILLLFGHGYYDALEQSDGTAVPFADECVRRENGIHTAGPRPAAAAQGAPAIPGVTPGSVQPGGRGGGAPAGDGPAPGATTAPAGGRGPTSASASNIGSMTCAAQLDTRFMSYIEKIELRRVWIADPETGLVFGLSMFRHPMNEKVLTLVYPDGTRGTRDMTTQRVFDMAAAHIFKVKNNKIYEIEASGFTLPLNSLNGWSEFVR